MRWSDNAETVISLCEWLDDHGMLENASSAIRVMRTPDKWQREYQFWMLWKKIPESCNETRGIIVTALSNGDPMSQDFQSFVRKKSQREKALTNYQYFRRALFNLAFGVQEPEEEDDD